MRLSLNKFVQSHKIDIAYHDSGNHSTWLSADDKITLSGFATAYLSSEGTVGDIRETLEVSGDLAESHFPPSDSIKPTPYQYDVRSSVVLARHIIQAERVISNTLDEMKNKLLDKAAWYAEILRKALSDVPFKSPTNFLNRFNQTKSERVVDFSLDFTKLESFTYDINYSRAYREDDDFTVETSGKEVYCSNSLLIKAWLSADPQSDNSKTRVVLNWLGNMAKLASLLSDYAPRIREFGITKRSGCLFATGDFVGGHT